MQTRALGGLVTGVVLTMVLAGCQPASPIVGKWNAKNNMMGMSVDATYEFKPDNTFVNTSTLDGQMFKGITIQGTGTYELKDKKLSVTTKDMKLVGELTGPLASQKDAFETGLKTATGKTQTVAVEFKDNGMTWSPESGGPGVTFTKVK